MLIGRTVFVYRNAEGFESPAPGVITGTYPEADTLVDLNAFFRKNSQMSHVVPMERVRLVANVGEAQAAFAKGQKFVACPYDPTDPKVFEVKELKATEAKPPTKPKR